MKKITLFVLLLTIIQIAKAQTVLKPGDIAIVQVNYTFNSFDFVCYVNIEAGTEIWFTDYAFSNTLTDFDKTTTYDGIYKFTAAQAIQAGTVIQYRNSSNVNSQFTAVAGSSSLSLMSYKNRFLSGENLIVYQQNSSLVTYLFALGWMRKDNFSVNPLNSNAKVCDIPQGLSKSNFTVIQIDSVMKPGQTPQLARDFRYNKYDGFTGTASKIRFWLSNTSNYDTFSGYYNNDAVPNFTVLDPDTQAPSLLYSYPHNEKTNTSIHGIGIFKFDEPVIALKSLILRNAASNEIIKTYTTVDIEIEKDSTVKFKLYPYLEKSTSYSLTIPKDYLKDYDGNTWPSESLTYNFATSANKSTIECCFPDNSGIIVNPYFSECAVKDDLKWTTIRRTSDEYGHVCVGYFSWTMSGLPMKFYMSENVESNTSIPDFPIYGLWSTNNNSRLVVDLTGITQNVTDIVSHVYDNYSAFFQKTYSGPNLVSEKTFSGLTGDRTGYMHFENGNATKLDSIVFYGYEGRLISFKMEVIDKYPPVVELGNSRVLCEGDSLQLDAGLTLGALYDWNTGAKTQKIWVKTSGTYSVTVKNSLGQASDNVLVTVKPVISLSIPDTIYACVGDTVTLTAGTNTENSYFWSPAGQTTPSIQVTQSGIYHVLVNNGFGGCFSTDSTRVIFKGAKLHAYHYQGGSYGTGDVVAELYRRNSDGKFKLYRTADMLQMVHFDSIASGEYILKSRFVNYSFVGENPWLDTYHDGKTEWEKVTPFKLTCETDTMIGFMIARKPVFEFNGTAVISGTVAVVGVQKSPGMVRMISNTDCDTRVLLLNSLGEVIATQCPDANGNYSFTNLPAGSYSIVIERTGYEMTEPVTTELDEGEQVVNLNFTVDEETQTVVIGITTAIFNQLFESDKTVNVFPNPARDVLNIKIDTNDSKQARIVLTDLIGQQVLMLQRELKQGVNYLTIQNPGLKGIYILTIVADGPKINKRVIFE